MCSVKLFKGTVHTKMKIMSSFINYVITYLFDFFPVEHKGRYFEKCLRVFSMGSSVVCFPTVFQVSSFVLNLGKLEMRNMNNVFALDKCNVIQEHYLK